MEQATPKKGISTWLGIIFSVLMLLPPFINQVITYIENNEVQFSGSEKFAAIAGLIVLLTTIVQRVVQAVIMMLHPAPPTPGAVTVVQHLHTTAGSDSVSDANQDATLNQLRELLTENPHMIQTLKSEGVLS